MSNELTVLEGQKVNPLMWFEFNQNNSGGSFDHYPSEGIGYAVWVQARNADEANARAQGIGLYFDGYGDCSCCGDRWGEVWGSGQAEEPAVFTHRLFGADENGLRWGIPTYAHRYDGTFYQVTSSKEIV